MHEPYRIDGVMPQPKVAPVRVLQPPVADGVGIGDPLRRSASHYGPEGASTSPCMNASISSGVRRPLASASIAANTRA